MQHMLTRGRDGPMDGGHPFTHANGQFWTSTAVWYFCGGASYPFCSISEARNHHIRREAPVPPFLGNTFECASTSPGHGFEPLAVYCNFPPVSVRGIDER